MTAFTTWRSLVDGAEISVIPDEVVDNFEDADGDPAGVYEEGETISDYYTGSTGDYARSTSNVEEGEQALETTGGDTGSAIFSTPSDGLNRYPEEDEKIGFLLRQPTGDPDPVLLFNMTEPGSDFDSYGAMWVGTSEIRLNKYQSGSRSTESTESVSFSNDTWYWGEIDPPTTEDNTIQFTMYELDNELQRGSEIGSVSTSDSDYIGDRGIGVQRVSTEGTGTIVDWIRILE